MNRDMIDPEANYNTGGNIQGNSTVPKLSSTPDRHDQKGLSDLFSHTVFLSSKTIETLRTEGRGFSDKMLRLIEECREALDRMPEGARGIVLGSGEHTKAWHIRGWETIDILPSFNPTYTGDANDLGKIIGMNQYDYVLAERITMNPIARQSTPTLVFLEDGTPFCEPAVGHENLLQQAQAVLKMGGRLIIMTADLGNSFDSNLPVSESYAIQMKQYGFTPVMEYRGIEDFSDQTERVLGIEVIWYAQKVEVIV